MARARSRKRRPAGASRAAARRPRKAAAAPRDLALTGPGAARGGRGSPAAGAAVPRRARGRAAKPRAHPRSLAAAARTSPTAPTYGERPPAPWHPLPISEVLILVGAIGAAIGFAKSRHGVSKGGAALLAGIGAVAIGTFEVDPARAPQRLPLAHHHARAAARAGLHSLRRVRLSRVTTLPRLLIVGLLAVDVALFAFLFRLLRARFLDARHARVLREG